MSIKKVLALVVLMAAAFAVSARANDLPAKPEPTPAALEQAAIPAVHAPFWDHKTKMETAILISVAAFDVAQTCHVLAHGGQEDWMPTQKCSVLAIGGVAAVTGVTLVEYDLHRHGHNRLERLVQTVAPLPNVAGITFSKLNGSF